MGNVLFGLIMLLGGVLAVVAEKYWVRIGAEGRFSYAYVLLPMFIIGLIVRGYFRKRQ